jgi:hypothetical protein
MAEVNVARHEFWPGASSSTISVGIFCFLSESDAIAIRIPDRHLSYAIIVVGRCVFNRTAGRAQFVMQIINIRGE